MAPNGNGWHKDTHWLAIFLHRFILQVVVAITLIHQILTHYWDTHPC